MANAVKTCVPRGQMGLLGFNAWKHGWAITWLAAFATENAELRQQMAVAQNSPMEAAIDAGHLHAPIEAVQVERDARRIEAERFEPPGLG
ncbi:hypothetical protein [Methylobacterium sp. NEAU K]|uniref:hypothetical protein n=1 Tax=Methylobacterium sp. NEAU K TaxID=3064946 RepID=UPI002735092B|nr:hypothetical protein [Methylobacterium sp. NEAU K]MDP4006492.1 hypothetical protein [Methylobacterium sp. NEAU K]